MPCAMPRKSTRKPRKTLRIWLRRRLERSVREDTPAISTNPKSTEEVEVAEEGTLMKVTKKAKKAQSHPNTRTKTRNKVNTKTKTKTRPMITRDFSLHCFNRHLAIIINPMCKLRIGFIAGVYFKTARNSVLRNISSRDHVDTDLSIIDF